VGEGTQNENLTGSAAPQGLLGGNPKKSSEKNKSPLWVGGRGEKI